MTTGRSRNTAPRHVARLPDGSRGFAPKGNPRHATHQSKASTMELHQPGVQGVSQAAALAYLKLGSENLERPHIYF